MSDDIRDLADRAAEAIRALNHLTRNDGLGYPSDVYDIIGSLQLMAQRLPQLFSQLGAYLITEGNEGRIRHDHGEPEWPSIDGVLNGLTNASEAADRLAAALASAQSAASHLTAT